MAKKVLVVDDDASVRDFLERLFKKHGYDVETAASGEAAAVPPSTARNALVSASAILFINPSPNAMPARTNHHQAPLSVWIFPCPKSRTRSR